MHPLQGDGGSSGHDAGQKQKVGLLAVQLSSVQWLWKAVSSKGYVEAVGVQYESMMGTDRLRFARIGYRCVRK